MKATLTRTVKKYPFSISKYTLEEPCRCDSCLIVLQPGRSISEIYLRDVKLLTCCIYCHDVFAQALYYE